MFKQVKSCGQHSEKFKSKVNGIPPSDTEKKKKIILQFQRFEADQNNWDMFLSFHLNIQQIALCLEDDSFFKALSQS